MRQAFLGLMIICALALSGCVTHQYVAPPVAYNQPVVVQQQYQPWIGQYGYDSYHNPLDSYGYPVSPYGVRLTGAYSTRVTHVYYPSGGSWTTSRPRNYSTSYTTSRPSFGNASTGRMGGSSFGSSGTRATTSGIGNRTGSFNSGNTPVRTSTPSSFGSRPSGSSFGGSSSVTTPSRPSGSSFGGGSSSSSFGGSRSGSSFGGGSSSSSFGGSRSSSSSFGGRR